MKKVAVVDGSVHLDFIILNVLPWAPNVPKYDKPILQLCEENL